MNNKNLLFWFLKSLSWALRAAFILAIVTVGPWLAFRHHNDDLGHRIGPLFIFCMWGLAAVVWLLSKAADRFR
jgi:hypothetical protein